MTPQDYFVLNIKGLKGEAEDWLNREAFARGALGISEVLAFDQPEGEETVFTRIPDQRSLDIYFERSPAPDFLREVRARLPRAEIRVKGEANRDWLEEWKKGFVPFALVAGHWVVPSWLEAPEQAEHKIWVDPGMAFGTGTHETTQLVAETLAELIQLRPAKSCLDVGTGTGILAILARQLGVPEVFATEIEADSRRVARENFVANGCDSIVMNDKQIEQLDKKFDVVIANIIDGVLVRVQESLKLCVAHGGWLVVSGIILERERDFLAGFQLPVGKSWARRVQKGDWLLFAVQL